VLHALADRKQTAALVGFDDFELADLLGTTVIRADPWRLGEQAAALAFARLDGDDRPPLEITVPTELIARGSGEVAA
jgi:LacI family transcriptional regulator, galactose operon repressor